MPRPAAKRKRRRTGGGPEEKRASPIDGQVRFIDSSVKELLEAANIVSRPITTRESTHRLCGSTGRKDRLENPGRPLVAPMVAIWPMAAQLPDELRRLHPRLRNELNASGRKVDPGHGGLRIS